MLGGSKTLALPFPMAHREVKEGQREQTAAHPHDEDPWASAHLCTCSGAENLNLIPSDTTWLDLVTSRSHKYDN